MRSQTRHALVAFFSLVAACSSSVLEKAVPCSDDTECGQGSYCKRALTECIEDGGGYDGRYTAAPGTCHRSCWNNACTCESSDDCPGSVCNQGMCQGVGVAWLDCAIISCPADCPQARLSESFCPICLCTNCSSADAGGACAANGSVCAQNSDCCSQNCISRNGTCCEPGGCP